MSLIDSVSLNLSNRLGKRLNKSNEEIQVLKYGIFVILHTLISILTTIFLGIATGVLWEICIISFCSASVKRYSGGVHATSPNRCLIIGVSLSLFLGHLDRILINVLSERTLFLLVIILSCFCYVVLYKVCPVPSKNKPMTKESTRRKLRKKTFNTINLYYILIFILFAIYIRTEKELFASILLSISLGVFMQTFALSNIGGKMIISIDSILLKYIKI